MIRRAMLESAAWAAGRRLWPRPPRCARHSHAPCTTAAPCGCVGAPGAPSPCELPYGSSAPATRPRGRSCPPANRRGSGRRGAPGSATTRRYACRCASAVGSPRTSARRPGEMPGRRPCASPPVSRRAGHAPRRRPSGWRRPGSARGASEMVGKAPSPISRRWPSIEIRCTQDREPARVTFRYSPSPSPCIPGIVSDFAFAAVSFGMVLPTTFPTNCGGMVRDLAGRRKNAGKEKPPVFRGFRGVSGIF